MSCEWRCTFGASLRATSIGDGTFGFAASYSPPRRPIAAERHGPCATVDGDGVYVARAGLLPLLEDLVRDVIGDDAKRDAVVEIAEGPERGAAVASPTKTPAPRGM